MSASSCLAFKKTEASNEQFQREVIFVNKVLTKFKIFFDDLCMQNEPIKKFIDPSEATSSDKCNQESFMPLRWTSFYSRKASKRLEFSTCQKSAKLSNSTASNMC